MPDVSRRALLRGVTFAGAASVGGASSVGTYAYLTDGEPFRSNSLGAGSLDLEIATRTQSGSETSYDPEQEGAFPSTFVPESSLTVGFPTVDSTQDNASGSTTVAFRVCENPGRVWLRLAGESNALADAMDVTVTYAPTCEESSGDVVYKGSLSGLFDAYADGSRLGANCQEVGTVELEEDPYRFVSEGTGSSLAVENMPGTLTLEGPNGPVDLEITGGQWKDDGDKLRGVNLAADDFNFCRVDVKGGNAGDGGVVTYRPDCTATATELVTDVNGGGQPSGLSHFVVFECSDDSCLGCEPACLTLDWELSDPKSVAGDSLSFDMELFASQCRHTNPTNPWQ